MSKDIMAINKQGDEIASLRYLASDENSMPMYFVLRPTDENGKIDMGNDVELLINEEYLGHVLETFNSLGLDKFYANDDEGKRSQKDKLGAFLNACDKCVKEENEVKVLFL